MSQAYVADRRRVVTGEQGVEELLCRLFPVADPVERCTMTHGSLPSLQAFMLIIVARWGEMQCGAVPGSLSIPLTRIT